MRAVEALSVVAALPAVIALTAVAALSPAALAFEPSPEQELEQCRALVRDRPDELESYQCFWAAARRHGVWEEAARALEALLALDPGNQQARVFLAAVEDGQGTGRAEQLYREAADGFADTGDVAGEIHARVALSRFLRRRGRLVEAGAELARAEPLAREGNDPLLAALVDVARAWQHLATGDYGGALGPLLAAEESAFPDGPGYLRIQVLSALGSAYWGLGMYRKGIAVYEREATIQVQAGDRAGAVPPRYNIALLASRLLALGEIEQGEYLGLVESALAAAQEAGHLPLELRSCMLLGQELEDDLAERQFRRALELSLQLGDRQSERQARRHLAQLIWTAEPARRDEALRWVDETVEDARSMGDVQSVAHGLAIRAWMLLDSGDREAGGEAYLRLLEAVEQLRDLQPEGSVRARVFSQWIFPYYRFSGALLEGLARSAQPDRDLELAFRVVERMRARVLLEELDRAGAHPAPDEDLPEQRRRAETLDAIAAIQKRLGDPGLPRAERSRALEELERLELEGMALRDALARAHPDFGRLRAPAFPTLDELRETLGPDQALLSFQLSSHEPAGTRRVSEGGSWLTVVTRERVRVYPLPDMGLLESRIGVFVGLLQRRDRSEARAAERLYRDLLGEALRDLDPGVSHLVIVPDRWLHRFPFGALRDEAGEPLALRYRISHAPSATVWSRWIKQEDGAVPPRGFVFADPRLASEPGAAAEREGDPWLTGLHLEALPHARREAAALARGIGNRSLVLEGAEASEQALKQADLSRFGVLYFAAHAVVDNTNPQRSAILLAAGAPDEDGMLQIREIVDLDLEGRVVVLTACRSASGTLLEGEGLIGLARGFFLAGARAVVGSLWPLRDDEAAVLMKGFSSELARGRSVGEALAAAQRARIADGDSGAAWSGIVVLGDGDAVPVPGGRGPARFTTQRSLIALGALLLVVALVLVIAGLRRRSRPGGRANAGRPSPPGPPPARSS